MLLTSVFAKTLLHKIKRSKNALIQNALRLKTLLRNGPNHNIYERFKSGLANQRELPDCPEFHKSRYGFLPFIIVIPTSYWLFYIPGSCYFLDQKANLQVCCFHGFGSKYFTF